MGKCVTCGSNFVCAPEDHVPDRECKYCEIKRLRSEKEILTMQVNLLMRVFRAAQYAVQHRYGENDPVGTRVVAIEDLKSAVNDITDWK